MENKQEIVVEVKRFNKTFIVNEVETKIPVSLTEQNIPDWMLRKAVKYDRYLKKTFYNDGRLMWRQVEIEDYKKAKDSGIQIPTRRTNRKKNTFEN